MKRNLLVITVMMAFSMASQAMMAPWYRQIRQIDTAVEAIQEKLEKMSSANADDKVEEADELKLQVIQEQEEGVFFIATKYTSCLVTLTQKELKKGPNGIVIAGAPGYDAKVSGCRTLGEEEQGRTMSYEKISAKLDKAASLGKMVEGVMISSTGKVKITYTK